ncbi:DUF6282 family protein [Thermostaphylospora chromogena]|uniref:Amidohydrolase n=1 Tax=Thermostaphylospora chromogena TaxID=35622 RepID=A0A1H1CZ69_9ACTN|nr:DUF6282 family protein [Thermostaphylospora chromogena]SDQ69523.1 hypothetical protein SAMN04489764_1735 [Thermostaphylospora chromogena]
MFDLHVHAAPDVWPRLADDAELVAAYAAAGYSGCVLKGHYDATAGRAHLAGRNTTLRVYGSVVLNAQAGGFNPAAVAAALQSGARVVWMPTADAHTQHEAGLPRLCGVRGEISSRVYAAPPVDPSTAEAIGVIVRLIADFDAVLATGHLSTPEVEWLLPVAEAAGVRRMMMTHPSYTVPAMSATDAARLARRYGALAEVTAYQLLHQPRMDAARLAAFVREVGYEHVVLSSDAGQPDSPPPPEALEMLIDTLAAEGLDRSALIACASELPERLVTP